MTITLMATFTHRYPLNVPGKYYIDDNCTDCDLCRECAPNNIKRDESTGISYVFKQPTTPEETTGVEHGVAGCPTEAVGNDGDQFDWDTTPSFKSRKKLIVFSFLLAALITGLWANWPIAALPEGTTVDRIVVVKHTRTLTLYNGSTAVKSYKISLGRAPIGPKEREGDKKTPEGHYRIVELKSDSSYHRALRISYPEAVDKERARLNGVDPGSAIMIHGIRNGLGFLGRAHRLVDWTTGCLAVTNPEMDQIFEVVADGAQIEIRE
jgi:L,D-peptidoglycan transpeptidase YkuD (ErfK/YbiS/YcfS/YnhG family)/ferredoxin